MRSRGSAIIIAFFLMAAISGVTFAIARLFYLDTSAADIYENSTVAYYAAESGVEEGLLRYRFDRQSEVPVPANPSDNMVNRNDLNGLRVYPLINPTDSLSSTVTDPNTKSIFDLRMSYKASFYGNAAAAEPKDVLDGKDLKSVNYGDEYLVPRDESVKIDITDTVGSNTDATFMVIMQNYYNDRGFDKDTAFIEARVVGTVGSLEREDKKILVTKVTADPSMVLMQSDPGWVGYYDKEGFIRSITGSVDFTRSQTQRVFLYLRPIGCDIIIGIAPSAGNSISAPYTTVKSTGYYGGISRTLEAKIDRQSGTVYDLFDFVTYQHP